MYHGRIINWMDGTGRVIREGVRRGVTGVANYIRAADMSVWYRCAYRKNRFRNRNVCKELTLYTA